MHSVISFEMTPSQDFTFEKATQTNFLSKLPCSEGLFWIFLCIFWQNSLRHQPILFRKKVLQKCPKSFQKQGPRISRGTANAQLGTSFFGTLLNPTIFKFQIMLALEHVSTPPVSKHKSHVFFGRRRTNTHPV